MAKQRIVLTGVTGLLGRNLLFEILRNYRDALDRVEIFVLGRGRSGRDIARRVRAILAEDGVRYLRIAERDIPAELAAFDDVMDCLQCDLNEHRLQLEPTALARLREAPIDCFYHIASLTDFRHSMPVIAALLRTNVYGTQQILDLVEALDVRELVYVGTAYSCGQRRGVLPPDYVNPGEGFRNPYERTKTEAELLVRDFARRTGQKIRIFRPSTIGGRLLEPPLGTIHKFDVFYAWAAWFLRLKWKAFGAVPDLYERPLAVDLRACYSLDSGLNIIPADYGAKLMYLVTRDDVPGESFHMVNEREIGHQICVDVISECLTICGVKHVSDIPQNPNKLERIYYKTVGLVFTPYMHAWPMTFDTRNIQEIRERHSLKCPEMNGESFKLLNEFAKTKYYGLFNSHDVE